MCRMWTAPSSAHLVCHCHACFLGCNGGRWQTQRNHPGRFHLFEERPTSKIQIRISSSTCHCLGLCICILSTPYSLPLFITTVSWSARARCRGPPSCELPIRSVPLRSDHPDQPRWAAAARVLRVGRTLVRHRESTNYDMLTTLYEHQKIVSCALYARGPGERLSHEKSLARQGQTRPDLPDARCSYCPSSMLLRLPSLVLRALSAHLRFSRFLLSAFSERCCLFYSPQKGRPTRRSACHSLVASPTPQWL